MSDQTSFWNRRKAAVAAEAEADQDAQKAQALAEAHEELEQKSDAEILAALELPDPDTLKMGDDFTAFMSKAVPDRIRRRALRTLWRSNPVLANVDMLVDYGEDFTDSATVIENLQTTYQVGKGMLKHVQEMARQAEERAKAEGEPEDTPIEAVPDDDTPQVMEEAPEPMMAKAAPPPEDDTDEPYITAAPRRMKFKIDARA